MKNILLAFTLLCSTSLFAQNDEVLIRNLLNSQTEFWNRGDIEGFMQTYWKNDSLMFVGKSGLTWGWQNTLNNYKKGYPDTTAMGKLSFDILQVKPLAKDQYFVVGKWMLKRSIGDLQGHYSLLLRRIGGEWKIVADHSS